MTAKIDFDNEPFWIGVSEQIDSEIKRQCFKDLRSYYQQLSERLDQLPPGDPQRLKLMVDINGVMAAMRSLNKTSDEEVEKSHAQFLEAAARAGFEI